jgi:hypothetical protein
LRLICEAQQGVAGCAKPGCSAQKCCGEFTIFELSVTSL